MSRFRSSICQKTLKTAISCSGVGLHSGAQISVTLQPAPPGHGIIFERTDVPGDAALIPATWQHVVDTQMCTVLGNRHGMRVGTIEHLMAALYGCEIDNVLIQINGAEVPAMDGSSAPFVFLIECAGIVDQAASRRGIEVLREVRVVEENCHLSIAPARSFSLDFEIDFGDNAVAQQACQLTIEPGAFKSDLARARTFGFIQDIGRLQAAGLARGGSLENAVIISGDRILNDDGLRFDDEFVRHKMLDCVGDLYLAGAPLLGHVTGSRTGHRHNNRLLHTLFADTGAFRYVDMVETSRFVAKPEPVRAASYIGLGAAD